MTCFRLRVKSPLLSGSVAFNARRRGAFAEDALTEADALAAGQDERQEETA